LGSYPNIVTAFLEEKETPDFTKVDLKVSLAQAIPFENVRAGSTFETHHGDDDWKRFEWIKGPVVAATTSTVWITLPKQKVTDFNGRRTRGITLQLVQEWKYPVIAQKLLEAKKGKLVVELDASHPITGLDIAEKELGKAAFLHNGDSVSVKAFTHILPVAS